MKIPPHNEKTVNEREEEIPILATTPRFSERVDRRRAAWFVLIFSALIFLPNAGSFGLWDPWETHYGEVTRNMVERADWVSPWWGFRDKIGTEPIAGKPFFSKPVYLFWIEAVAVKVIGLSEWAMRLPIAGIAMATVFTVFLVLSRLVSTGTGVLAAVIVATSPQFFFLGRQAQTDMPFVGTLTMALLFFLLAVFGPAVRRSRKRLLVHLAAVGGFLCLSTLPWYGIIATDLRPDAGMTGSDPAGIGAFLWHHGGVHATGFILLLTGVVAGVVRRLRADLSRGMTEEERDQWSRRAHLWMFYILAAHATLAKGLLGFLLPGAVLFTVLLTGGRWRVLARVELVRGLLIFLAVGLPWYLAMFARHGMAYYTRFFVHDHFNRLGSGVHQIDSGTFEHFIKWLGIGMFPWVAFVPIVLLVVIGEVIRRRGPHLNVRHFLLCWVGFAFLLFSLSSTKFHHYIFPCLPPLAILVAMGLRDMERHATSLRRIATFTGLGVLATVGWDLAQDPQTLRNLFTYKYDRKMPDHLPIEVDGVVSAGNELVWGWSNFYEHTNAVVLNLLNAPSLHYEVFIRGVVVLALLSVAAFSVRRWHRRALVGVGAVATLLAVYGLNVYLPMFSVHWSQKYMFEAYYEDCTPFDMGPEVREAYVPLVDRVGLGWISEATGARGSRVCDEDVLSWLITWRGEAFYGNNEVLPIQKEATQFESYLRDYNRGRAFYVMMERGKDSAWEKKLNSTYLKRLKDEDDFKGISRFEVERIHEENRYFVLVKATPMPHEG